jgi:hypothetical protein
MSRPFVWILPVIFAGVVWPQTLEQAAHTVAAGIAAGLAPHATVSLAVENYAGIPGADIDRVRQAMQNELNAAGFAIGESDQKLVLAVSDDVRGHLLIAQLGDRTAMAAWQPAATPAVDKWTLTMTPVIEERDPVLDLLFSDDENTLLVLEPSRVIEYARTSGQWALERVAALPLVAPLPRDPRARFAGTMSRFEIDAPGNACSGSAAPALSVTCGRPAASAWVDGRDYFRDPAYGFFYTKAEANGVVILAGVDGIDHMAGNGAIAYAGWGSDLAAVHSRCGSATQVIATKAVEDQDEDQLTAFEIAAGGRAIAVSDPLPIAGAVTALWPSAGGATLVVKNVRSGYYEASRLAIACSR